MLAAPGGLDCRKAHVNNKLPRMTDPREANHWDLLASELGATPPPPDEKPAQVEADDKQTEPKVTAQMPPASRKAPPSADSPPRPRRTPTDWSQLAEQLGLERQEAAPPPSAAEPGPASGGEVADAPEGATEVAPGSPGAVLARSPGRSRRGPETRAERALAESEQAAFGSLGQDVESADAAPAFMETDVESTTPPIGAAGAAGASTRTDLVPIGTEAELPGIPGGRATFAGLREGKPQGRGRRKRRKKPQKPVDEKPVETALEEPASESKEELPAPLAEEPPIGRQPEDSAVAGLPDKEEQSQERSKRRRRRRSSAKKKGAGKRDDESAESGRREEIAAAQGESESPHPSGTGAVLARSPDRDRSRRGPETRAERGSTRAKPEPAKAESDGSKGSKPDNASKAAKGSHRSIPSWEEAVGIIIAGNMEARAKRTSGSSSSRSRGGRNRGGRDKSGEKAS